MLDELSLDDMRTAVTLTAGRAKLEASGGINDTTLRTIAETGVDYISIGKVDPDVIEALVAGEDRAAVINRTFDRIGASYGQRPSAVSAVVVWGTATQLADVASLPAVAAVEPAPADAAWGSFAVRPPS